MAKDRIFCVDFYPETWLIETNDLTLEQRGVYIQICALIYAKQSNIQNDAAWIARNCNCPTRTASRIILELISLDKLQIVGEQLTNRRCKKEIYLKTKRLELSNYANTMKKLNGGELKENNTLTSDSGAPLAIDSGAPPPLPSPPVVASLPPDPESRIQIEERSHTLPEQKKDFAPETDKKPARKPTGLMPKDYTIQFLEFWQAYPKNNGSKHDAFKSYHRATTNGVTTHETIIAGTHRFANYCAQRGTEERFTAHASTWLNQRRWEADYATPINGSGNHTEQRAGKGEMARRAAQQAIEEMGDAPRPRQVWESRDSDHDYSLF